MPTLLHIIFKSSLAAVIRLDGSNIPLNSALAISSWLPHNHQIARLPHNEISISSTCAHQEQ